MALFISLLPRPPHDVATRPFDKQVVEYGSDLRQFAGDFLPERLIVPQALRFHATHDALALLDQLIEFFVAADIEPLEPLEEFAQVVDGRIAKRFGLAVVFSGKPFGQVRNQVLQFFDERLFGQSHRIIESSRDPFALLAVQVRMKLLQIVRRFDRRKIPADLKQAGQAGRIVGGIVQRTELLTGCGLQLVVMTIQGLHRDGQLLLKRFHLGVEVVDVILPN